VCDFYLSGWPFDPVFGQRDEVPRKPDPAAAFEIAKGWGIEPERILFVGDSDNDILTAKAAGMLPLGVSWGYGRLVNEPVEGMGELMDNPSDILNFIS
jgi:phosphoglycolate phosphatase